MSAPSLPTLLSRIARRPLAQGPLGVLLAVAGLVLGIGLAVLGVWWEAALMLALAVLAWRLRWHALDGRRCERLARDEVLLQARLLDAVGEAVVGCSPERTIVYWNRAAERLLGWPRSEAVGRDLTALLPGLAELQVSQQASGQAVLLDRNGRSVTALVTASPLDPAAGGGAVLVLVDLTRQHAVERGQRVLAEAGAVLSSGLGMESTLTGVARRALPVLGEVCLVDVVEQDGPRRVGTLHAQRRSAALAEAMRAGGATDPLWPDAIVSRALAGETLCLGGPARDAHLEDAAAGVLAVHGCHAALVVPLLARGRALALLSFLAGPGREAFGAQDVDLAQDLADRVAAALDNARLLQEEQKAARSKEDFLAVMSHELRTPLTAITGYADLVLGGAVEPLPEKTAAYVQRMRGAAWHLLGIIEQILAYARLEEAREHVDPGRVALAHFVRDTAALMQPVAADKGVAFSAKAPAEEVTLVTDATKLRQILLNLLSNAVKFTDSGVVALTATLEEDTAVFEVRDTGVGIAPEHLERIFEPFWQVDQSSARRAGGTGIGLSVAQRQARLLGGTITAASSPGEGTTFTLRIPAEWSGGPELQALKHPPRLAGSVH